MSPNTKTWLKRLAIVAILVLIAFAAYTFFKPKGAAPSYITATATIGDIESTVLASGKLEALKKVNVGAQVSGEVTDLYVSVGEQVQKGQPIAKIDAVTQQNTLENQTANLEQANAELASREAELGLSISKLNRLKPLMVENAISAQDFEVAQNAVTTARASVASAKARLKQAKAQVDTARQNLGYTSIVAPISGTVLSVVTEQGQTLNAMQSAPTIVTLADLTTLRVKAQISEADVIHVRAGLPVYFTVLGDPEKKYHATLKAIEPAPLSSGSASSSSANAAVYYIGYFDVPNLEGALRIDMTAQVYIVLDRAQNVLTVPAAAIKTKAGKSVVRVLPNSDAAGKGASNDTAQGEPVEREVTVGLNNRVTAEIISGLQAGDEVVLSQEKAGDDSGGGRRPRMM